MFRFTNRQIEIFLAVCHHGSFRQAADALKVSEAAVSSHMRTLEDQLGKTLFVRHRGRSAVLSDSGAAFRVGAMDFVRFGIELGNQFGIPPVRSTHLHFYVGPHLLDDVVRPALPQFLRDNPQLSLTLSVPKSRDWLRKAVLGNAVDGAFVIVREADHLPNSELLGTTQMAIFATKEVAAKARAEGLSSIDYLLGPEGSDFAAGEMGGLTKAGVREMKIGGRYQFHEVGVRLAQQGMGALITLDSIIQRLDGQNLLEVIKVTAIWERRLFINPNIPEGTAAALRNFFTALN